ncbi:MAG: FAD-dependent thymidylate synthase [Candidatus Marsarchaeota archaeon]|nr:FAD-dependent thymidylate synthase [Candidatus Marsarchaeota archaeon]MCL5412977.1 FAD-dependent thymidylate synthase [Candidatus Marsarchaeota archaeon]
MSKAILRFDEKDDGVETDECIEAERIELEKVVTNTDSNVYAWKLGGSITAEQVGALLSRYSRTSLTGRRLYLKEFLPNRGRGREFFEAWLVDYGDDSIQEMAGGLPMSCEFISNLAVNLLEDSRMGSYIEKSTRYVYFDRKLKNGEYMFYKDRDIEESSFGDAYDDLMRSLFDSYTRYVPKMAEYIKEQNPFESQKFNISNTVISPQDMNSDTEEKLGVTMQDLWKSYDNAIKANALDFMRDYLPMSILTHVGVSMNARSYENTIMRLLASPLRECNYLGRRMHAELSRIIPSLLKRIDARHGITQREFMRSTADGAANAALNVMHKPDRWDTDIVKLCNYAGIGTANPDREASINTAAFIIYRFGNGFSLGQSRKIAESMPDAELDSMISSYVGNRLNRRHKPGRAFENISYTFDFCSRIGIYRDLHRHRIGTQERQRFTAAHGYNMRSEYASIGIDEDYRSKMSEVKELFGRISETMPYQAQYVVTFGFNVRWYYTLNARQMFHFCELRTGTGGHPDYRDLAQKVYLEAKKVHPTIMKHMKFVDMGKKKLGRLESEIRIAQKRKEIQGHLPKQ